MCVYVYVVNSAAPQSLKNDHKVELEHFNLYTSGSICCWALILEFVLTSRCYYWCYYYCPHSVQKT